MAVPLKKKRVKLDDTSSKPKAKKSKTGRVRLDSSNPDPSKTSNIVPQNQNLTPEALAYALPGGLARLAYPKWMYNPFIRDVENRILKIAEGKSINIMFSAPPRHGKSLFIDRVLPAWFLGHNPDKRVLLITYQDGFSRTTHVQPETYSSVTLKPSLILKWRKIPKQLMLGT